MDTILLYLLRIELVDELCFRALRFDDLPSQFRMTTAFGTRPGDDDLCRFERKSP